MDDSKLLALTRGKRADHGWELRAGEGWVPSLVDRRRLVGEALKIAVEENHGRYTSSMIKATFGLHSTDEDDRTALAECFARWMRREDQ